MYGPDPNLNPRLSTLVAFAKKSGFPKARIENAIARGQGKATDGRNLEFLLVEAMVPPSIAVIIECQTDSRARTLETIKQALKHLGGSMTKTCHLFKRKGKILFGQPSGEVDHELFEKIIDSNTVGADFVDEDKLEVYSEPNQTNAAAEAISNASSRIVESKEIIWEPTPEAIVDVKSSNSLVGLIGNAQLWNESFRTSF